MLNRPFAFVQWLAQADIPEAYVLMSEPDHVWLRPMPNLMAGERMAAFPFFYIEPAKPDSKHITEKFTGPLTRRQAEAIAPMGAQLGLGQHVAAVQVVGFQALVKTLTCALMPHSP